MVDTNQTTFVDEIDLTIVKTMYNVGGGDLGQEYLAFIAHRFAGMTNTLMAPIATSDSFKQRHAKLTLRATAGTISAKVDVSGLDDLHASLKRTRQFRTVLRNFYPLWAWDSENLVDEFKRDYLYPWYHEFKQKLIAEGRWNPPTLYLDDKPQGERP